MKIYFTTSNPRNYNLIKNWESNNEEHLVLWAFGNRREGKFSNATVNEDYVFLMHNDSKDSHENEKLFNCKIIDDNVTFTDKNEYLNNEFDREYIKNKNYTDNLRFYKLKILGMTTRIRRKEIQNNQNEEDRILDRRNNYCQDVKCLTNRNYLLCNLSSLILSYGNELGLEQSEINFLQEKSRILSGTAETNNQVTEIQSSQIDKPRNLIVFGAPGTGKSYFLNDQIKDFKKIERVTFYPSYSYSQFVGCYKPVMNGENISYSFVPGPFLRTYVDAVNNPSQNYLLIIEEINRADAASVFGDVFQLLDRDQEGNSVYSISASEDIKKYLEEKGISSDKLSIPSNMYIWATMNSADQGVFPMDTAFKRRWDFLYFDLDGKPIEDNENCPVKKSNWEAIRKSINKWLCEKKVNEDKHLGKYFLNVGENVGEKDFRDAFKNKVLMYLYEDAARAFRSELFEKNSFSAILKEFNESGTNIFKPANIKSIANGVANEVANGVGNGEERANE